MRSFIVDVLATHRLTRLVTEDVFTSRVRQRIFKRYPPTEDSWSYALTCEWCTSVWTGLLVAGLREAFPRAWPPVANALAASSLVGLAAERQGAHGAL